MIREDIVQVKLDKLKNIREFGMEAYPEKTRRDFSNAQALAKFDEIVEKKIFLVGRVRSLRPMGGSAFANIEDESGKMQLFLNKGNMPEELFRLFVKNVELGDFVQVTGQLFLTKTLEQSLKVTDWKMLCKNIRPIPTEHFGIKNEEQLLRQRYLDLMINPDTRELFRKKNVFWQTIRNFLAADGFLEVQNPVFENTPGGADAEPFVTHHKALDQDFFMRISLELSLKRLLVGGYEKVFEIGRVFRNEGIDRHHLQEFDHREFYAAYWDFKKGMEFAEKMSRQVVKNVTGGFVTEYEGATIDWEKEFPVVDYFDAFKAETGLDLAVVSLEALRTKADELGIKYEKTYGKGRMIDTVYKKTLRLKMIQPCFLVGHPIEVSPLAKMDPANPNKVLRFQIVAGTAELCNAFAELNDPIDQRERFESQMALREAGDTEAQMIDEDFVAALEYGMPPAFGFGLSERFFAFLVNKSVRECVIFPPMKDREQ